MIQPRLIILVLALCGSRLQVHAERPIDPATMNGKLLMGYQGWFACPGDGSPPNRWVHWFRNQTPNATNVTVDFWPDISEMNADELFDTGMTLPDGTSARVYSAAKQKTVLRHLQVDEGTQSRRRVSPTVHFGAFRSGLLRIAPHATRPMIFATGFHPVFT